MAVYGIVEIDVMSKKKEHHEEHVDETWLIPYADMLTLLLALFIVMFAMSKVDKQKLEKMSEQFNVIFSSGSNIFEKDGKSIIETTEIGAGGKNKSSNGESIEEHKKTEEIKEMNDVKEKIQEEVEKSEYSDKVNVVLMNEYLEITIQDVVLFETGGSEILKGVYPVLTKIATSLTKLDNDIRVAGHTDNMPINTEKFRSNWDLSAIRAINVMNFIIDKGNLNPKKLSVQAYGEYTPKFNNSTEEGRSKNRRVEILLMRKYNKDDKVKPNIN
jgi:chemotaxis protein MotB